MGWRAFAGALVLLGSACGRTPLADVIDAREQDDTSVDCDRADFLFVIDDSPSMQTYQRKLVDSFPLFIAGVDEVVERGTDLHVGVITTDAYAGNPTPCDRLGGLVIQTRGAYSSRSLCGPYAEGANYMTEQDDLAESFACAASVGTQGGQDETPAAAILAAVDPEGDAAACNQGFLRDDALLVVVILSDEPDGSDGDPRAWAEELTRRKGGNREGIVVVSLLDERSTDCAAGEAWCFPWRNTLFTESFPNGYLGPIDGDYGSIFGKAIDVVGSVCAAE